MKNVFATNYNIAKADIIKIVNLGRKLTIIWWFVFLFLFIYARQSFTNIIGLPRQAALIFSIAVLSYTIIYHHILFKRAARRIGEYAIFIDNIALTILLGLLVVYTGGIFSVFLFFLYIPVLIFIGTERRIFYFYPLIIATIEILLLAFGLEIDDRVMPLMMERPAGAAINFFSILLLMIFAIILNYQIGRQREKKEGAEEEAIRDPLTGLLNRRRFDDVLADVFKSAKEKGEPLSILFIDIDFFKSVNDTYGHRRGDDVLKQIGNIITRLTHDNDIATRYGGEEFVLILKKANKEMAIEIGERIRKAVKENDFNGPKLTVSIGITSVIDDKIKDEKELIKKSDDCLYIAKKTGRNRVVFIGSGDMFGSIKYIEGARKKVYGLDENIK